MQVITSSLKMIVWYGIIIYLFAEDRMVKMQSGRKRDGAGAACKSV
ncbi:hypothetical protein [Acetobacter cibinongensis]|nr:hypothetical protein [Acetobacter cibinongensis]